MLSTCLSFALFLTLAEKAMKRCLPPSSPARLKRRQRGVNHPLLPRCDKVRGMAGSAPPGLRARRSRDTEAAEAEADG